MCKHKCVEEIAMDLAEKGKVQEARDILDRDTLRKLNQMNISMRREQQWNNIKSDISSVVWFPVKAIAFILCSPLECIIRIIEAIRKK